MSWTLPTFGLPAFQSRVGKFNSPAAKHSRSLKASLWYANPVLAMSILWLEQALMSRCQCYKKFTSVIYEYSNKLECLSLTGLSSQVYCWGLPLNGTPERCFTQVSSSLTHKCSTRLERHAWAKRSSLLGIFVNYESKNIYNIGPRCRCYITHFLWRQCFPRQTFSNLLLT
jgi:hypothetical protein